MRQATVFDFVPVGVVWLHADGTIGGINGAAAELLKCDRERAVGRSLEGFIDSESVPSFRALLAESMNGTSRESRELALVRDPGLALPVRARACTVSRTPPEWILSLEDLSQYKATESALSRTEQALHEANRSRDDLVAALSHELRNPLGPIRNSLAIIVRDRTANAQTTKAASVIERQVAQLNRMIDDLIEVARLARGAVQIRRDPVEISAVVRRVTEDAREAFGRARIRLEIRTDADASWIDGDDARLTQALAYVLDNARKFTPPGGRVEVIAERCGDGALVHVRDSGVGIGSEVLAHAFEPFAQGPQGADRTTGGLGLGLAMVKGIIELHGGTVSIASEGAGKGTEVTLALPMRPAAQVVMHPSVPPPAKNLCVLVIDDNVDAADTLRALVELNGHEAHVAYDGASGLEMARRVRPQVVFCDIGLPEMDGYDVARALRADESLRGTCLIALSGYGQAKDRERAAAAGFDRHIAKPARSESIEKILAEARDGRTGVRPFAGTG